MTSAPDAPTTPPHGKPPAAAKPRRRWLKRLLLGSIMLFAGLLLALWWLAATESGLRFGLTRLPSWFGVDIRAKTLNGTLWRGFDGEDWQIETEGSRIDISSLALDWDADALWQRHLHVRRLAAGDIHITSKPTPPRPDDGTAATLPQSISLPFTATIDSIEVGAITSGSPRQVLLLPSSIQYRYDHQQHHLQLVGISTPWHRVRGDITLATTAPFALNGRLNGQGLLDDQAVESQAVLSGSLETPELAATMQGESAYLKTDAKLKPFALPLNRKIISLNLLGRQLNPQAFWPGLPRANIDFSIGMAPAIGHSEELDGVVSLVNAAPAAIDNDGLPVKLISGRSRIDSNGRIHIPSVDIALLRQGSLQLSGSVDTADEQLNLTAELANIGSQDLLLSDLPGRLNGQIRVNGHYDNPQADWQLATTEQLTSQGSLHLLTDQNSRQQTLLLDKLLLTAQGGGKLEASGSLALFQQQALQLDISSTQFNPQKVHPDFPAGQVNGQIKLKGTLADKPDLNLQMQWQNSTLSGAPLAGRADVHYQDDYLSRADANISLGRNRIVSNGSLGRTGSRLNLDINAPQLNLFGFGLEGLLTAKGFVAGSFDKPSAQLNGQARGLRLQQAFEIQTLDFAVQGSPDVTQPLNIRLNGRTLNAGGTRIDSVDAEIRGRGNAHSLRGDAQLQLDGKPYRLNLNANGGFNPQYQWRGRVAALDIGGAFNLKLLAPLQLEAGAERVVMNNARWAAMGGSLNLQSLVWDAKQGLTSRGDASNLAVQQLDNIIALPVEQNLILSGDWDLSYSNNARGYLRIRQQSGDIILPQRKQPLGLDKLLLETRFQNGLIDNRLTGNTRYGTLDMRAAIAQAFGDDILQARLSGYLKLNAPDLNSFRYLMPVGMEARGSLVADATLSGTVGNPQLNGTLNGSDLYYRERGNGVILENGSLKSRFEGRRWLIDDLIFKRKDGQVALRGMINLVGTTPDVDVTANFNRYAILDQVNRRLTLSGQSRLLYSLRQGVTLSGELKVDQGHFGFPKAGMPTLDDDVVVLGREQEIDNNVTPISLNLTLDLNDNFRFSGEGLDVLLGGKLAASSQPKQDFQVVGTVNIVRGQYKAYGQDLIINQGSISFVGPVSNPNLKLRATRRFSPVGAGVEVLGNLDNPRVSLVADEPMSEKDRLSWLILGRASSGSAGDEAALSAAASAWLAGGINDRIGLVDELGITSQQTRDRQTGELNPAEQVVTVGKRLTNDLYLGYQIGLESAIQTVKLTYQINRTLQVIAKAGTNSVGGEIRYSIRFD